MSGLTGAVMTSGKTTVVDWSVVMSPSSPWTVTRGRAAAAILGGGTSVCDWRLCVRVRRKVELGLLTTYIVNGGCICGPEKPIGPK